MNITQHVQARMSQRGINKNMIDIALTHGRIEKDRYVLGKKEVLQRLESLQQEERLLKKILDKGGVVVVAAENNVITTYNYIKHYH